MPTHLLRCPKCGGTTYDIVNERLGYGNQDGRVFTCSRCGKQVFGTNIDILERAQVPQVGNNRTAAQRAEDAELEMLLKRKKLADQEAARRAELEKRTRDFDAWKERTKHVRIPAAVIVAKLPPPTPQPMGEPHVVTPSAQKCAWKDCTNTASATSKYCSRNCSNKNARYLHRLRGKG